MNWGSVRSKSLFITIEKSSVPCPYKAYWCLLSFVREIISEG